MIPENVISSVHLAVVKLKKVSSQYYLDVFEGMRSEGIGVQLHYIPIYKQPFYSKFNFDEKNFPGSEEYSSTAMSIPIFPGLNREEQLRVRKSLKKFFVMNILVIPARGGSKRIPRKNIKKFKGKPIIEWTINAVKDLNIFQKIIVSTDDKEIAEITFLAGSYEDMYKAINLGGASAVAAASIFHFSEMTPLEAKNYLQEKGIPIRANYSEKEY